MKKIKHRHKRRLKQVSKRKIWYVDIETTGFFLTPELVVDDLLGLKNQRPRLD